MAVFNLPILILSDRTPTAITGTTVGTTIAIDENIATGSLVATMTHDGTAASFAIASGNTNGDFAIANNGDITVANSPDYETTSSYSLGITATDAIGNTSAPFTVTININDLDEIPPAITLVSQPYTAVFESDNNLTIASFTATDAGSDVTNSLTLSGTPNATNFALSYNSSTQQMDLVTASSGLLGGGVTADQTFTLTVSATDAAGNTGSQPITLVVKNAEVPTITSGATSITVQENSAAAAAVLSTYTATGTLPITWSLTGADSNDFNINSSGELTFSPPADYETQTSHSINAVATNQFGSDTRAVSVTVTNDPSDDPFYFTIPFPTNATSRTPEDNTMYADNSYIYWIGEDNQTSNGGHEHQLVRVGKSGSGMNFYNALASSTDSVHWSFWSGSYFYAKDNPGSSVNGDYLRRFSKTGGSRSSVLMSDNGSYAEDYPDAVVNDNGNYYAYRSGAQVWGKFRVSDGLVTQTYSVSYNHGGLKGAVVINVTGTNYIYALDGGTSQVRRYNAPSGSGTAFSNVGTNSISWPTSNTSTYRGIAYDGSHVWICRGDEIAKFAVPSSASGAFLPSP